MYVELKMSDVYKDMSKILILHQEVEGLNGYELNIRYVEISYRAKSFMLPRKMIDFFMIATYKYI